jgi:hypothetical protein
MLSWLASIEVECERELTLVHVGASPRLINYLKLARFQLDILAQLD